MPKRKYADIAKDNIAKLKSEIDKDKERLGTEILIDILINKFDLTGNAAFTFLKIVDDMVDLGQLITDVNSEAIPANWFFEKLLIRKKDGWYTLEDRSNLKGIYRKKYKNLHQLQPQIRKERDSIKKTIKHFWDLKPEQQEASLHLWKKKYHDHLKKREINLGRDHGMKKYNATELANLITASRYSCKESTIESFAKPGR